MKIVAGLGSAEAYDAYVDAGADEVFCGYVPERWMHEYGMALPLNRREVRFYGVQLGGRSELLRLAERIDVRGVPATITLNSLHYVPAQYPQLAELVAQCLADGFRSFIVADMGLLVYLHRQGLDQQASIHISGELGEVNRGMIGLCGSLGARRIIFHRKVALKDMASCVAWSHQQDRIADMEFEAFALNEMCHFNGAFCQSLHCDELAHMCRMPYRLGSVCEASVQKETGVQHAIFVKIKKQTVVCDACYHRLRTDKTISADLLGATGCGLCALWQLREAGVTHLKLVGRGNHVDTMLRDISAMQQALDILAESPDEGGYIRQMYSKLFPEGCAKTCYYLDVKTQNRP